MKRKLFGVITAVMLSITNANAGIPTFDGLNLIQNVMTVLEETAQTLKQIDEYRTQLQQYENMLQNTMQPAYTIWTDAQVTINNLREAIDTLNYYKTQLGSLDGYLDKFGDLDYYVNSPCFNGSDDCTPEERALLEETRSLGYESQQRANRALFEGLDQQQDDIENDARRLQRLQVAAESAEGQLEAIGYANQLASQQANQLLQIRGLLMAQQNAVTTRMQAQTAEEARGRARFKQITTWTYSASPTDDY
ncbi:MAG: P-type conjugative transfer protein TrbJ [Candidatus Thiodiazotropha weberae]|nr:P-type conjugative transfer protein TrbJ [Candidatus Thiodiazotropha lotti]MCG8011413.1 P-type conjugative transfer protein TrbJ [Candidatus Thiodiazotropha lotti]MCG8020901.1 P-type conjugative transfer protein TrbJ [Candidatus Thiodiazotropha lotti]MCW4208067.1 P-type conjugative transfer protein TrbJ [Candidatus Thiodiazotropha lotti]MCW4210878.1 P-type conjugative transfer protein TrbJ [Candidatus Thiodiazotropha lotti]